MRESLVTAGLSVLWMVVGRGGNLWGFSSLEINSCTWPTKKFLRVNAGKKGP
jgi:preprotein translocase subunit SecE